MAKALGLPEPEDTVLKVEPCLPFSDLKAHLSTMSAALRAFTLAYIAIYYIHGGEDGY